MKKFFVLLIGFLMAGCIPQPEISRENTTFQQAGVEWERVADGIAFTQFTFQVASDEEKDVVLVSIDPALYHFEIRQNKNKEKAETIKQIAESEEGIVAFNGNFFDEHFQPLGFLKDQESIIREKISPADLMDGIFVIDDAGKAILHESQEFLALDEKVFDEVRFALQNGPILLNQEGHINLRSDTKKEAARTALGITKDGKILLILLKPSVFHSDNVLSLYQFAKVLQEQAVFRELGLHSVLNLDGGPSSGLLVGDRYYPEMEKVQNVVVVNGF